MAIEIRRLMVSEVEFSQICANYVDSSQDVRTKGTLMDLQTITDKPLEVSVSVQTAEGQQITLILSEDLLVAAFIGFCSSKKFRSPDKPLNQ